ncbi:MAG: type II secretion system F family protein, partial [Firmicutes bacterium]|nr:type II secretion system F family protein [Bacillota bacterium]
VWPDPRPLSPWAGEADWRARARDWWWTRLTRAPTRARARVLGLTPARLLPLVAVWVVGLALGGLLLGLPGPLVGGLALALALVLPDWLVRQLDRGYQQAVTAGLPLFLNHLRLLLDMAYNLPDALGRLLPRLPPRLAAEIARVLRDLRRGRPVDRALGAFADRVGTLEAATLAVTLAQAANQRLTGATLDPLDTLIAGIRQRRMYALTGSVRTLVTGVTPLVALALLLEGAYFFIGSQLLGLGIHL